MPPSTSFSGLGDGIFRILKILLGILFESWNFYHLFIEQDLDLKNARDVEDPSLHQIDHVFTEPGHLEPFEVGSESDFGVILSLVGLDNRLTHLIHVISPALPVQLFVEGVSDLNVERS